LDLADLLPAVLADLLPAVLAHRTLADLLPAVLAHRTLADLLPAVLAHRTLADLLPAVLAHRTLTDLLPAVLAHRTSADSASRLPLVFSLFDEEMSPRPHIRFVDLRGLVLSQSVRAENPMSVHNVPLRLNRRYGSIPNRYLMFFLMKNVFSRFDILLTVYHYVSCTLVAGKVFTHNCATG
jgi:hypothetical protein